MLLASSWIDEHTFAWSILWGLTYVIISRIVSKKYVVRILFLVYGEQANRHWFNRCLVERWSDAKKQLYRWGERISKGSIANLYKGSKGGRKRRQKVIKFLLATNKSGWLVGTDALKLLSCSSSPFCLSALSFNSFSLFSSSSWGVLLDAYQLMNARAPSENSMNLHPLL